MPTADGLEDRRQISREKALTARTSRMLGRMTGAQLQELLDSVAAERGLLMGAVGPTGDPPSE
jgi:hypothetical protein